MFQLLRWMFFVLACASMLWFAITVPVGKYTLWGHLTRIAHTREARDLTDGAKAVAKDAAGRVKRELSAPEAKSP